LTFPGSMNRPVQPLLLAIEASTDHGSIAVTSGEYSLGEQTIRSRATLSKRLLPMVRDLLAGLDLALDELDGVAVGLGPGSFTGLRIALATAKGLTMALGKPLLGVPSLDGLVAQLPFSAHPVCAVTDARKGEVYAALYRTGQGQVERMSDYLVLPPERLSAMIDSPTILVGNGAILYRQVFAEHLGEKALITDPLVCFPRAASIGALGKLLFQEGSFLDPLTAVPLYVRPSDAQVSQGKKG